MNRSRGLDPPSLRSLQEEHPAGRADRGVKIIERLRRDPGAWLIQSDAGVPMFFMHPPNLNHLAVESEPFFINMSLTFSSAFRLLNDGRRNRLASRLTAAHPAPTLDNCGKNAERNAIVAACAAAVLACSGGAQALIRQAPT